MRLNLYPIVLISLVNLFGYAQTTDNYPVQTTVYFGAPTTPRLSEWFTSDQRIFVLLQLKDLTKPTLPVYLRWQLEGPGIRIATRTGYVPPAFFSLIPGHPSRLSGTDLAAHYFSLNVLETEGLEVQEAYNASLPEGFYTFSVQAFEAATGQVVSNTAQTFLALSSPQPPILNLPANGTSLPVSALQKVLFQWTPRHFATPTSQVVYRLKVCRVPQDEEPNEQTMLSCTEPVLDNTAAGTSLTGDMTQWIQPLQPGQRYAVQLQAIDLAGELTHFANQGYSQVQWFRYGQQCLPPSSFTLQSVTSDRVRLRWEAQPQAPAYVVDYKAENATEWTSVKVNGTTYMAAGLQTETTYVFRLRSDCGGLLPSSPSPQQAWNISQQAPASAPEWPKELLQPELIPVQTVEGRSVPPTPLQELYVNFPVSTPTAPNAVTLPSGATPAMAKWKIPDCALRAGSFTDCQPTHPVIPLPTGEELTSLRVGDVLGIYDFAVFVTKVGEGPGFSGEGLVRLPFLGNALMPMEFKGVQAKKGEEGTHGGCVYAIDAGGYVQSKNNVSAQELMEQRQSLIQAVVQKSHPTAFAGTLQQALQKYDVVAKAISEAKEANQPITSEQMQQVSQYTAAILQGSNGLKTSLEALNSDNVLITGILTDLKTLTDELTANQAIINKGQEVPVTAALEAKYQALFERIRALTASLVEPPTATPTAQITNVSIAGMDAQSATISWAGSKPFAKYTVVYAAEGDGELTQSVTSPTLTLKNLKPGRNYTLKILGYDATGTLLDTYGPGAFTTPANVLPPPENVAYTLQADGSVKITWKKNSLHQNFQLTYKDASGEERTLYPTTNSAVIPGLPTNQRYSYSLVAFNNDQRINNAVDGSFRLGTVCYPTLSASVQRIVEGTSVTLRVENCQNGSGEEGVVKWFVDNEPTSIAEGSLLTYIPQQTTAFTASCTLTLSDGSSTGCRTSPSTVTVEKKCTGAAATITPGKVFYGDPVMLQATGCGEATWFNETFDTEIGKGELLFVTQKNTPFYIVKCQDSQGKVCYTRTDQVTISENCDNFKIVKKSYYTAQYNADKGSVTYEAVGCPNGIFWEYDTKKVSGEFRATPNELALYGINNKKPFTLTAKCGNNCRQSVEVRVPACKADLSFVTDIRNDAKNAHKIVSLSELRGREVDFLWTDNTTRANVRILPLPTQGTRVYSVIPIIKNTQCEPIEIGIEAAAHPIPKAVLDCVPFELNITPNTIYRPNPSHSGAAVYYDFIPSGCTDGFTQGIVHWDTDITDQSPYKRYNKPTKNITHTATCVVGDVKVVKTATLIFEPYSGDPVSIPGDFGFSDPLSGIPGTPSTTDPTGTTPTGTVCTNISHTAPSTVTKGDAFSFTVSCNVANGFITIEDRQHPAGTGGGYTEGYSNVTIERPSSYFDYTGIARDWTKPMEFRANCYDKKGGKTICSKTIKISVSCGLTVEVTNRQVSLVKGCEGQNTVIKYFPGGGITPRDNDTYYRVECRLSSNNAVVWCSKEGNLPPKNARQGEIAASGETPDCAHISKLPTRALADKMLQKLICEQIAAVLKEKQPDGTVKLSPEKAKDILEAVKKAENTPQLQLLNFKFAGITNEMIQAVVEGNCDKAVAMLTAPMLLDQLDLTNQADFEVAKEAISQSVLEDVVKETLKRKVYIAPNGQLFTLATAVQIILCPTNQQIAGREQNGFSWGFKIDGVEYQWTGTRYENPLAQTALPISLVPENELTDNDKIVYLTYESTAPTKTYPYAYLYNLSEQDYLNQYLDASKIGPTSDCDKQTISCTAFGTEIKLSNGALANRFYEDFVGKLASNDELTKCALIQLANLVEEVGPDLYNTFVAQWEATQSPNNHWFLVPTRATGSYDIKALSTALNDLRDYWDAVRALQTATPGKSNSKESIIALINDYFVAGGGKFKILFTNAFKYLSAQRRIEILSYLASGQTTTGRWNIGSLVGAEDIIVTLLETAPADQAKAMLDGLQTQKLIFPLFSNVDGANFEHLINKMTEWVLAEYPLPKPVDLFEKASNTGKYFTRFNGNLFGRSNTEQVIKDGSVEIETVKHWYNTSDFSQSYKFKANPYEYIKVRFETDLQIGGSGFVAGKDYMLPALYVYLLFSNDTKQKWITTGKIAVDVALMALGSAEIVAASRAGSVGGFVLGAIDMGLGVGDIVLNQAYHNEIIAAYPESGEAFCCSWQAISLCYGIGRLAGVGLGLDVGKVKSWLKNDNWRTNSNLSTEAKAFLTKIDGKLTKTDADFGQFAEYLDDVNDALRLTRAKFTKCGCGDELTDILADRIKNKLSNAEIDILDEAFINTGFRNAFIQDPDLIALWKLHKTQKLDVLNAMKRMKNKAYKAEFDFNEGTLFEEDIEKLLNDMSIQILKHNYKVYEPSTGILRGEVDFELSNVFIESTVGDISKTKQMRKYVDEYPTLFNPNNKPIVVYGPQYRGGAVEREITSRGGRVIRDFEGFLNLIR